MLTNLTIQNFRQFSSVEIELGNPVVFIGPNNSGKTTALQALALWDIGVKRWTEKRSGKPAPEKRPGVTINRKDLIAVPTPASNLLWRDLHTRDVKKVNGKQTTTNVHINVVVDGVSSDQVWSCGMEFDYANEESFYCRPKRIGDSESRDRMSVPPEASSVVVAYLPPMSGLTANETRLDPGAINVRIGEGRTAEVLRNLCYQVATSNIDAWGGIVDRLKDLFGVTLDLPEYIAERGEVRMSYGYTGNRTLDISCAGRGLQQTLLLLAHIASNPRSVLLLDEPDAHLEILRQRQIYEVLTTASREQECQVIAASHSEIILNEAAERDVVVAFIGAPHRIDDRGSQLLKSLKSIGYEHYYQAEQTGWVLYLEGSTDLDILRAFATSLGHRATECLKRPFVHYVENQPHKAREHFFGLREAKSDLRGFMLFDHGVRGAESSADLPAVVWERREIENYLCQPETLYAYAKSGGVDSPGPLFARPEADRRVEAMEKSVKRHVAPAYLDSLSDPWWQTVKASDELLDRVFEAYLTELDLPTDLMRKTNYHQLAIHVPRELISPEVTRVLDAIAEVASAAKPRQ